MQGELWIALTCCRRETERSERYMMWYSGNPQDDETVSLRVSRTCYQLLKKKSGHTLVETIGLLNTLKELSIGGILEDDGQVLLSQKHLHLINVFGGTLGTRQLYEKSRYLKHLFQHFKRCADGQLSVDHVDVHSGTGSPVSFDCARLQRKTSAHPLKAYYIGMAQV